MDTSDHSLTAAPLVERSGDHGATIILYDGVCALCNRLNRFVLEHDRRREFRFASLQSEFARRILGRHGADSRTLDTLYVVLDHDHPAERLLSKSNAISLILSQLDGPAALLGRALHVCPRALRDIVYDQIARRRYRYFGRYDACPLPAPEHRALFLDDPPDITLSKGTREAGGR